MTAYGHTLLERRKDRRHRVLSCGKAFSARYPRGVHIVLRDVSDTGCLLVGSRVEYVAKVDEFIRIEAVEEGSQVKFDAQVRWRANKQIGVQFLTD